MPPEKRKSLVPGFGGVGELDQRENCTPPEGNPLLKRGKKEKKREGSLLAGERKKLGAMAVILPTPPAEPRARPKGDYDCGETLSICRWGEEINRVRALRGGNPLALGGELFAPKFIGGGKRKKGGGGDASAFLARYTRSHERRDPQGCAAGESGAELKGRFVVGPCNATGWWPTDEPELGGGGWAGPVRGRGGALSPPHEEEHAAFLNREQEKRKGKRKGAAGRQNRLSVMCSAHEAQNASPRPCAQAKILPSMDTAGRAARRNLDVEKALERGRKNRNVGCHSQRTDRAPAQGKATPPARVMPLGRTNQGEKKKIKKRERRSCGGNSGPHPF